MPQGFSVDARGSLFLERQGKHNWIKYQLDVSLKFVVPPLLSWVPKHVLQRISESVRIIILGYTSLFFAVLLCLMHEPALIRLISVDI